MNKNRAIEESIKRAVDSTVPDILPNILQYMDKNEGSGMDMISTSRVKTKEKSNKNWIISLGSLAAAFLLVFGLQGLYYKFSPESVINFDVNPSIELKVNRGDKVIDVNSLNQEGKEVIGDMKLKNIDLDIAVNALIGSMVKNGYISSLKNSILVSVNSKNGEKGQLLQERLSKDIEDLLGQYEVSGSVLSQNIGKTQDLKDLSKKYEISSGKAALIKSFVELDDTLSYEDLAKLSINDLNLLIKDKYNNIKGVEKIGNANDGYIGKEKAKNIALSDASISEESLTKLEIEIDHKKGRMIYEIEFDTIDTEYEYKIDAINGSIIEIEKEVKHNKDKDSNMNKDPNTNKDPNSNKTSNSESSGKTETSYIGKEKAKNIALSHAGFKESEIRDLEIELDREDGIMIYEVEFEVGKYEYEYEIDALSGQILKWEKELD